MNCEEALTRMMQILDGEGGPGEDPTLTEHLGACPVCRGRWERLRRVDRMLRTAPAIPPQPGLAGRILTRLEHRRRNAPKGLALALVGASALLLSLLPVLVALPQMPAALRVFARTGEVLMGPLVGGVGSLLRSLWLSADAFFSLTRPLILCGAVAAPVLALLWLSAIWRLHKPARRTV